MKNNSYVKANTSGNEIKLLNAVKEGKISEIKFLLTNLKKKGRQININARDENGSTALMIAVYLRRERIAQLLINNGADVNAENDGDNILKIAVLGGHEKIIQMLIKHGANINARDKNGSTALMIAEKLEDNNVIRCLDAAQFQINQGLISAINAGNYDEVTTFISRGASVNLVNQFGDTILMQAVINGNENIVKILLDRGAEINAENCFGNTVLMYAVVNGHEIIVKILLDRGAEVNTRTKEGSTILIHAVMNGHENIAQMLLDRGADVNARTKDGRTALMFAAERNHTNIAIALIQRGAKINELNKYGFTSLTLAAAEGYLNMVKILIKEGATIDNDAMSQGILGGIVEKGYTEITDIFIEAGVDINTTFKYEETLLMIAAKNGHEDIVDILIENQANLDKQHRTGRTALIFAIMKENKGIATKLILAGASTELKDYKNNSAVTLLKEKKYYDLLNLVKTRKPNYLVNTIAYVPCDDRVLEGDSSDEDISGEYEEHMLEFDTSDIKSLPFKTFQGIRKDEPKQEGTTLGTLIRGDIKPRIIKQDDRMESIVVQPFLDKLAEKAFYEPDSSNLQRVAVSFALNRPRSLSTRRNHCLFNELEAPIDTTIKYKRFGLFWEYEWYDNENNIISFKEVRSFYKQLKRYDKENGTNKAEIFREINEDKVEHMVPYQALRERLKNHKNTKELVTRFRSYAPNIPIYFGIVDSDVISFNRIFLSYDQIYLESKLFSTALPVVMTTGYEFPARAKELPESFDSKIKEMVPALKVASQLDRTTRIATATVLPTGVYYPEPNLFILVPDGEETIPESFIDRDSKDGRSESKVLLKQVKKREGINKESFIFSAKLPLITTIPDRAARYHRTKQKNYIIFSDDFKKERFQRILIEDIKALKQVAQSHVSNFSWAQGLFTHKVTSLKGRKDIISDICGSYKSGHPLFSDSIEEIREQAMAVVNGEEGPLVPIREGLLPKEKVLLVEEAIKKTHIAIAKFILGKIELFGGVKMATDIEEVSIEFNTSFSSYPEIIRDVIGRIKGLLEEMEEERREIVAANKTRADESQREDLLSYHLSKYVLEFENSLQVEKMSNLSSLVVTPNMSKGTHLEEPGEEIIFKVPMPVIGRRKRGFLNNTDSRVDKRSRLVESHIINDEIIAQNLQEEEWLKGREMLSKFKTQTREEINPGEVERCLSTIIQIAIPLSQALRMGEKSMRHVPFNIREGEDYFSYLSSELMTRILLYLPESKIFHPNTIQESLAVYCKSKVPPKEEIKAILNSPEQLSYRQRLIAEREGKNRALLQIKERNYRVGDIGYRAC